MKSKFFLFPCAAKEPEKAKKFSHLKAPAPEKIFFDFFAHIAQTERYGASVFVVCCAFVALHAVHLIVKNFFKTGLYNTPDFPKVGDIRSHFGSGLLAARQPNDLKR